MDDKAKGDAAAAAAAAAAASTASKSSSGRSSPSGNAAAGAGAGDGMPDLGEVKGFKLDVLAARRPALVQELMTFRDALLEGDEEEGIKVLIGAVGGRQGVLF